MFTDPNALHPLDRRDVETGAEPAVVAISPSAPRRRPRWLLRVLLGINVLVLVLFVISRLEPSQIKPLGPAFEYVNELLNPADDAILSKPSEALISEVTAL